MPWKSTRFHLSAIDGECPCILSTRRKKKLAMMMRVRFSNRKLRRYATGATPPATGVQSRQALFVCLSNGLHGDRCEARPSSSFRKKINVISNVSTCLTSLRGGGDFLLRMKGWGGFLGVHTEHSKPLSLEFAYAKKRPGNYEGMVIMHA